MNERYKRNRNLLSEKDQERLSECKICVVGCGGLGGYVIEMLVRIGIGAITAVDGDVFEVSNLNRQLLSEEGNIGTPKAKAAKNRAALVNSNVKLMPIHNFLNEENADDIIRGHDVVIDALDNIKTRKILERACSNEDIPMVHGAIGGWYGQVTVIFPGDFTLEKMYPDDLSDGIEAVLGNPSFTPATVASIQVSECIKLLLGKEGILRHKLLTLDLLNQEYDILQL